MAFAEKDAVVAQFFRSPSSLMDLVDVFDAAVDAVQAEFHGAIPIIEALGSRKLIIHDYRLIEKLLQLIDT